MKQAAVLLFLLFASAATIAQVVSQSRAPKPADLDSSGPDQATRTTLRVMESGRGCPVEMRAERVPGGELRQVEKPASNGLVQRLRLIVAGRNQDQRGMAQSGMDPHSATQSNQLHPGAAESGPPPSGSGRSGTPQIVAAKVTVHGYSGKARMLDTGSADAPEVSRVLDVNFLRNANGEDAAFLSVTGLTAVQDVDVESLTYADGSTWKVARDGACRIVPNPLMLIDAAR